MYKRTFQIQLENSASSLELCKNNLEELNAQFGKDLQDYDIHIEGEVNKLTAIINLLRYNITKLQELIDNENNNR